MKPMALLLASVALISVGVTAARADEPDPSLAQRLATSENRFGFNLLKQLENPTENVFLSPTSIHLALSMTYNGASGKTKAEMAKVLGVDLFSLSDINSGNRELIAALSTDDPTTGQMAIANSLWVRQGIAFRPPFLNAATESYGAKAASVNMNAPETLDTINGWVKEHTDGKIPSIIDHIDRGATIFLINAVHFKAAWQKPLSRN